MQSVSPCSVCGETVRHAPLCLRAVASTTTKPRMRPQDRKRIAELLALLRDASPPFGQTAEKRERWVQRRDEVINGRRM